MLEKPQIEKAVGALVSARRRHERLAAFPPNAVPKTLDDAYAVQEAFARRWSSPVVGYKVGCASPESQRMVGANGPFVARIYGEDFREAPATLRARDFFAVGVEAEFAFRMAMDFAPRGRPSRADTAAAVGEVIGAIEICDTRLADWKAAGIPSMVADNGFHGALVAGQGKLLGDLPDLAAQAVTLTVNGALKGQGTGSVVLGHPLESLAWLASELARRGHPLRAGDVVAAGTCTGLHFISDPAEVVADFGPLGRIDVKLVP